MRSLAIAFWLSATGIAVAHTDSSALSTRNDDASLMVEIRNLESSFSSVLRRRSDSERSSATKLTKSKSQPSLPLSRSTGMRRTASTRSDAASMLGPGQQIPRRRRTAANNRPRAGAATAAEQRARSPDARPEGHADQLWLPRQPGARRGAGVALRLGSPALQNPDIGHAQSVPPVVGEPRYRHHSPPTRSPSPPARRSPAGSALVRENSNPAMYGSWNGFRSDSPPPIGLNAPRISAEDLRRAGFQPGEGFAQPAGSPASSSALHRSGSDTSVSQSPSPSPRHGNLPLRPSQGHSSAGSPGAAMMRSLQLGSPRTYLGSPRPPRLSPTSATAQQMGNMNLESQNDSPHAPSSAFEKQ